MAKVILFCLLLLVVLVAGCTGPSTLPVTTDVNSQYVCKAINSTAVKCELNECITFDNAPYCRVIENQTKIYTRG